MNATERIEDLCRKADNRILAASYVQLPFPIANGQFDFQDKRYRMVLEATQQMIRYALADMHEALAVAMRISHDYYAGHIQVAIDWYQDFAFSDWPGTDAIPPEPKKLNKYSTGILSDVETVA